jgi:hypothetical protein
MSSCGFAGPRAFAKMGILAFHYSFIRPDDIFSVTATLSSFAHLGFWTS